MQVNDKTSNIPVDNTTGRTIFQFFTLHNGADVVLIRNLAMKRFRITEHEYNYWLRKWRFGR